ncbi:4-phosphoerythronate dehydrogenase [Marinilabiliaceae bacterium ANBcel2]|nr:4-phosphoerythronate dehydrogenase [Marinilabiliaceae bacterium ANBcel2]
MKIVIDDKIPYIKNIFEPYAKVLYIKDEKIDRKEVKDADLIIIRTRTLCDHKLLSQSKVKMVATATIGTDHIDTEWLAQKGIKWTNAPGCNSGSVMQYISSTLALLIKQGVDPEKTTVGIVGVGNVGSKVEKIAKLMGFKILLNDPPRERKEGKTGFYDYKRVMQESDIITFHTPLIKSGADKTHHLFNNDSLNYIKKGAVIINSARGEITETNALIKGVDNKIISKLAIDVWENEPTISKELFKRVWIGTPHIAGYSADGKANATKIVVNRAAHFFNLPLKEWSPDKIPVPKKNTIELNRNASTTMQLCNSILKTYNVTDDYNRLKLNINDFEKLRGDYPLRREFNAWNIKMNKKITVEESSVLSKAGFQIQ